MTNWIDVMVEQERFKDMARFVEQERLARQIPSEPGRFEQMMRPALARFGRWLEGLGRRLQARAGIEPMAEGHSPATLGKSA